METVSPVVGPPLVLSRSVRLGRLIATADFLAAVDRPAMIRRLRSHTHALDVEGEPVETRHGLKGALFRLRTNAERSQTTLWLEGEG